MLEVIVLVLLVVGMVGMFKSMTKEERNVIAKSSLNVVKVSGSYSAKMAKDTLKVAYKSGEVVGKSISLEHQETLTDLNTFNTEINADGGAIKVGIKTARRHLDTIGVEGALSSLDTTNLDLETKLREARAQRA